MRLVLFILILASYSAHAEIYRWTDNRGTDHFTNSVYEIPERYKAKAKTVNLGIPEPKADQPGSSQPAPAPVAPQPSPTAQSTPSQLLPEATSSAPGTSNPREVVRTRKSTKASRRSAAED